MISNVPSAALRVLVVDDQELVRAGFALILQKAGMEVVGQAGASGFLLKDVSP